MDKAAVFGTADGGSIPFKGAEKRSFEAQAHMQLSKKHWYVYIVHCSDGSLYTGISTNLSRREYEHNNDKIRGAKSLRGKLPVRLIYSETFQNRKLAAKREREIKGWRREKKLQLLKGSP